MKHFLKKISLISCLTLGIITPTTADDIDVLGQFLEQNLSQETELRPISTSKQLPVDTFVPGPELESQSALIVNNRTGEVIFQKNPDRVMSIASISKLMAAMVFLDGGQSLDETVTITEDEIDRIKGTSSRLSIGTTLTRGELLHLGLMSSENRAIHALGRTYPGGLSAFVAAMNRKAQSLGMTHTRFYEPTGLDFRNVSTARELSKMVAAASRYPLIRQNSTSNYGSVYTSAGRFQQYKNSNMLVREGLWDIELQKTGYIRESGRSMVVKANIQNQPVTIVLLNSPSTMTRVNDARRIRTWMAELRSS